MTSKTNGQRERTVFLLMTVSAVLIYAVAVFTLGKYFLGWAFFSTSGENNVLNALRFDSGNASYEFFLGKKLQTDLNSPSLPDAISHYKRSISLSPLQSGAWVNLAKAHLGNGDRTAAEKAFERAVKLSPNDGDLLWEAGTFWLVNEKPDLAVSAFRRHISLLPENQNAVYDLCWKLRLGNAYILENLVPKEFSYQSAYLRYLINTKRPAEAQETWASMEKSVLDKPTFLGYVNFLITNGLYREARLVWLDITGKMTDNPGNTEETLVWNNGFERDPMNGGLDWRIKEKKGVDVFIDDNVRMSGTRSLGVSFNGQENPDISFAEQLVLLKPGASYVLKGYIKTEGLTTSNGILLQVLGHRCEGLAKKTEVVTGTTFWKEVSVDFDVPTSCEAGVIQIRRDKSAKLDNKIEGTGWIDGISLKEQASSTAISRRR